MCDWVWVNKRKKQNSNPRPGTVAVRDPMFLDSAIKRFATPLTFFFIPLADVIFKMVMLKL